MREVGEQREENATEDEGPDTDEEELRVAVSNVEYESLGEACDDGEERSGRDESEGSDIDNSCPTSKCQRDENEVWGPGRTSERVRGTRATA